MEKDLLMLKTLFLCAYHKAIQTGDEENLPVLRGMAQHFMEVAEVEYNSDMASVETDVAIANNTTTAKEDDDNSGVISPVSPFGGIN